MELALILSFVELIAKHGAPAAIKIVQAWQFEGDEPTLEDIQALKDKVPPAEKYFEGD